MNKLSKFWKVVFAPILMQDSRNSDRDFPFRPVTIARRTDPDGKSVHSGRRPNN